MNDSKKTSYAVNKKLKSKAETTPRIVFIKSCSTKNNSEKFNSLVQNMNSCMAYLWLFHGLFSVWKMGNKVKAVL